jgi:hypothetical protein
MLHYHLGTVRSRREYAEGLLEKKNQTTGVYPCFSILNFKGTQLIFRRNTIMNISVLLVDQRALCFAVETVGMFITAMSNVKKVIGTIIRRNATYTQTKRLVASVAMSSSPAAIETH